MDATVVGFVCFLLGVFVALVGVFIHVWWDERGDL